MSLITELILELCTDYLISMHQHSYMYLSTFIVECYYTMTCFNAIIVILARPTMPYIHLVKYKAGTETADTDDESFVVGQSPNAADDVQSAANNQSMVHYNSFYYVRTLYTSFLEDGLHSDTNTEEDLFTVGQDSYILRKPLHPVMLLKKFLLQHQIQVYIYTYTYTYIYIVCSVYMMYSVYMCVYTTLMWPDICKSCTYPYRHIVYFEK